MASKKKPAAPHAALYAVLVTYPHHPKFGSKKDFLKLSCETYEHLEVTDDLSWARDQQQYYQDKYPTHTYTVVSIQPI